MCKMCKTSKTIGVFYKNDVAHNDKKKSKKRVSILLIDFYRKFISPLFPSCCRYYPTCSAYTKEAIIRFGFFKGTYLGIKRICRCNPFFKGGIDKVPEKFSFFKK